MVDIKKLIDKWEKDFSEEKKKECEDLHNAIAEVIGAKRPSVQNLLFVLEMLKFEALSEKFAQLFLKEGKPPSTPPLELK